jgi:hypothetical protein
VEKSVALRWAPVAVGLELAAGGLDEQALRPVTAAMARTAADIRLVQGREVCILMWLTPCGGDGGIGVQL